MLGIDSGSPEDHKKANSDKLKNWNWENWKYWKIEKNRNILIGAVNFIIKSKSRSFTMLKTMMGNENTGFAK